MTYFKKITSDLEKVLILFQGLLSIFISALLTYTKHFWTTDLNIQYALEGFIILSPFIAALAMFSFLNSAITWFLGNRKALKTIRKNYRLLRKPLERQLAIYTQKSTKTSHAGQKALFEKKILEIEQRLARLESKKNDEEEGLLGVH